jgi:hypothetical protein
MSNLTVETQSTADGGLSFRRSDGKRFFMIPQGDGSASLYAGIDKDTPPQEDITGFGQDVPDKPEAAKKWVLSYPNSPTTFPPMGGSSAERRI